MYSDYNARIWPSRVSNNQSFNSSYMDYLIENMAISQLRSKHLSQKPLLPSDVYRYSTTYNPLPKQSLPMRYSSFNIYKSDDTRPILPRPSTPVALPRISHYHRQSPFYCHSCHRFDFSKIYSYNRESSFFPPAEDFYLLQTDYDKYYKNRIYHTRRFKSKRNWRIYGFILIFYFMLKKNLRLAKQKNIYYHRDYRRIRFLELLTAVHRVYLEPNSPIHRTLSHVVHASYLLSERKLFLCAEIIINNITNFIPRTGILGTSSNDSVLIYLLSCTLEQYPSTYFWAIEKHLLSISFRKMKENGTSQLDHFTIKFLIISAFMFRCLIKTLLLKPVKYRLVRGKLNHTQWLNTRLLSTLLLCIARYAILYKENSHLPMPFPYEMKNYLLDDEKVEKIFRNVGDLIKLTAPKLSAWSCEYAEQLQSHTSKMRTRK